MDHERGLGRGLMGGGGGAGETEEIVGAAGEQGERGLGHGGKKGWRHSLWIGINLIKFELEIGISPELEGSCDYKISEKKKLSNK